MVATLEQLKNPFSTDLPPDPSLSGPDDLSEFPNTPPGERFGPGSACLNLPLKEMISCLEREALTGQDDISTELTDFLDGLGDGLDSGGTSGKYKDEIANLLAELNSGGGSGGFNTLQLDALNQDINRILGELDALNRGGLPLLDPETKAQLDQILSSRLGQADFTFEQEQAGLLSQLFGSNINRSTIAATAGTNLLIGQDLIRQQILSDDATLRINLRVGLRDAMIANLSAQASIVTNQQQISLGLMQLEQNEFLAIRGQNMALLGTYINADSQWQIAELGANTQLRIAEIDAILQGFGLDLQQRSLDLTELGLKQQYEIALKEIALKERELSLIARGQDRDLLKSVVGAVGTIAAFYFGGPAAGSAVAGSTIASS